MQKCAQNIYFPERMQPQDSGACQLSRSANPHPIQRKQDYGRVFPSPQCTPQIINPVTHHNATIASNKHAGIIALKQPCPFCKTRDWNVEFRYYHGKP